MLLSAGYVTQMLDFGSEDSEKVSMLIQAACAQAERIACRELEYKRRTSLVSGMGTTLFLSVAPVATIESVIIKQDGGFTGSPVDPSTFYLYEKSAMIELLDGMWPRGKHNIQVIYYAGYQTDQLPGDITKALLEMIQSGSTKMNDNAYGYKSKTSPDGVNITYDFDMTLASRQALESLRLEGVGI